MNKRASLALGLLALCLSACSGGFSGDSSSPTTIMPPQGVASSGPVTTNSAVRPNGPNMLASSSPTPPSGDVGAYPFAQAAQGFQCPAVAGFTCFLQFNINAKPTVTHAPSASPSASPSPSSSPSPTSSPTSSASPTSSPTPATPMMLVQVAALPTNAPPMVASSGKTPKTQAIMSVRLHTDADVKLSGGAVAQFTLPADQFTSKRAFAIQLFHEVLKRRTSWTDRFVGSYASATISGTTLRFTFTPPAITIHKDDLWLLVLYGDAIPTPKPSPSASVSPSPSVSPTSAPTATPT